MDPTELPENVLAGPAATSASASATSVAPQPSAPATGTATASSSRVQRNLASDEHQTVNVPPPYPTWLRQFGADLVIPLATTPEASVVNINAIPASPSRPIPSTSSSEAWSPTPTCLHRSGARASTPSPTKSTAAASSSESQSAARQGPVTRSGSPTSPRGSTLATVHEHES